MPIHLDKMKDSKRSFTFFTTACLFLATLTLLTGFTEAVHFYGGLDSNICTVDVEEMNNTCSAYGDHFNKTFTREQCWTYCVNDVTCTAVDFNSDTGSDFRGCWVHREANPALYWGGEYVMQYLMHRNCPPTEVSTAEALTTPSPTTIKPEETTTSPPTTKVPVVTTTGVRLVDETSAGAASTQAPGVPTTTAQTAVPSAGPQATTTNPPAEATSDANLTQNNQNSQATDDIKVTTSVSKDSSAAAATTTNQVDTNPNVPVSQTTKIVDGTQAASEFPTSGGRVETTTGIQATTGKPPASEPMMNSDEPKTTTKGADMTSEGQSSGNIPAETSTRKVDTSNGQTSGGIVAETTTGKTGTTKPNMVDQSTFKDNISDGPVPETTTNVPRVSETTKVPDVSATDSIIVTTTQVKNAGSSTVPDDKTTTSKLTSNENSQPVSDGMTTRSGESSVPVTTSVKPNDVTSLPSANPQQNSGEPATGQNSEPITTRSEPIKTTTDKPADQEGTTTRQPEILTSGQVNPASSTNQPPLPTTTRSDGTTIAPEADSSTKVPEVSGQPATSARPEDVTTANVSNNCADSEKLAEVVFYDYTRGEYGTPHPDRNITRQGCIDFCIQMLNCTAVDFDDSPPVEDTYGCYYYTKSLIDPDDLYDGGDYVKQYQIRRVCPSTPLPSTTIPTQTDPRITTTVSIQTTNKPVPTTGGVGTVDLTADNRETTTLSTKVQPSNQPATSEKIPDVTKDATEVATIKPNSNGPSTKKDPGNTASSGIEMTTSEGPKTTSNSGDIKVPTTTLNVPSAENTGFDNTASEVPKTTSNSGDIKVPTTAVNVPSEENTKLETTASAGPKTTTNSGDIKTNGNMASAEYTDTAIPRTENVPTTTKKSTSDFVSDSGITQDSTNPDKTTKKAGDTATTNVDNTNQDTAPATTTGKGTTTDIFDTNRDSTTKEGSSPAGTVPVKEGSEGPVTTGAPTKNPTQQPDVTTAGNSSQSTTRAETTSAALTTATTTPSCQINVITVPGMQALDGVRIEDVEITNYTQCIDKCKAQFNCTAVEFDTSNTPAQGCWMHYDYSAWYILYNGDVTVTQYQIHRVCSNPKPTPGPSSPSPVVSTTSKSTANPPATEQQPTTAERKTDIVPTTTAPPATAGEVSTARPAATTTLKEATTGGLVNPATAIASHVPPAGTTTNDQQTTKATTAAGTELGTNILIVQTTGVPPVQTTGGPPVPTTSVPPVEGSRQPSTQPPGKETTLQPQPTTGKPTAEPNQASEGVTGKETTRPTVQPSEQPTGTKPGDQSFPPPEQPTGTNAGEITTLPPAKTTRAATEASTQQPSEVPVDQTSQKIVFTEGPVAVSTQGLPVETTTRIPDASNKPQTTAMQSEEPATSVDIKSTTLKREATEIPLDSVTPSKATDKPVTTGDNAIITTTVKGPATTALPSEQPPTGSVNPEQTTTGAKPETTSQKAGEPATGEAATTAAEQPPTSAVNPEQTTTVSRSATTSQIAGEPATEGVATTTLPPVTTTAESAATKSGEPATAGAFTTAMPGVTTGPAEPVSTIVNGQETTKPDSITTVKTNPEIQSSAAAEGTTTKRQPTPEVTTTTTTQPPTTTCGYVVKPELWACSLGGTYYSASITVQECIDYCIGDKDCTKVEYNKSNDPGFHGCWVHKNDFDWGALYDCGPDVDQYQIHRGC